MSKESEAAGLVIIPDTVALRWAAFDASVHRVQPECARASVTVNARIQDNTYPFSPKPPESKSLDCELRTK